MYADGTRVVLPDGREGVIEVSSPDDWAYHVRLDSGTVVHVPENWIEPIETKEPTEDEQVFGKDAWVYCRQHMRAHPVGWCTVSVRDKVGLGVTNARDAYEKCRDWGLELYSDKYNRN